MNTFASEPAFTLLLLGVATALVHAMFQIGASVLTLLSGHSLGLKKAHLRLLHLNYCYIAGTFFTIVLVTLCTISAVESLAVDEQILWVIAAIFAAVIGCAVNLAYYRRSKGTTLWLPRGAAEYLATRAKKTTYGIEAAALGSVTVIAELPFAIAPFFIISLLLRGAPRDYQLSAIMIYALLVIIPLLVIAGLVGSGHKISTIQRWRENNKKFLQYTAGTGFIVIALYLTVFLIAGASA